MIKKTYFIGFLILILDQIIKLLVINFLPYGEPQPFLSSFFALTYTKNTGGAFSILRGNVPLLSILGCAVLLAMIYYIQKNTPKTTVESLATGALLGGLIGNLVDRIFRGGVIDFLDFTIQNYHYPVFNLADIAIVCGIIGIFIIEMRGEDNASRPRKHSSRSIPE